MKTPSPACFATWETHDVVPHEEWFKVSKNMVVTVQRVGSNWGYLVLQSELNGWTMLDGEFNSEWTAVDACKKAEEAWAKATGATP